VSGVSSCLAINSQLFGAQSRMILTERAAPGGPHFPLVAWAGRKGQPPSIRMAALRYECKRAFWAGGRKKPETAWRAYCAGSFPGKGTRRSKLRLEDRRRRQEKEGKKRKTLMKILLM